MDQLSAQNLHKLEVLMRMEEDDATNDLAIANMLLQYRPHGHDSCSRLFELVARSTREAVHGEKRREF